MRSEFVHMYKQPILDMIGNVSDDGRMIDWKEDAGESAFIERQLELVEGRVYEYKLRPLPFRQMFPVSNEGQGAETIGYDLIRGSGIAKIIASGSDDLPRADTFVDRNFAVVRPVGIAFGYTTRELRQAAFGNVPLEARRGQAAARGMEEKLSDLAWNGDSVYNIVGLLDNTNITNTQAASPATGSDRTWSGGDKIASEVIADISSAITAMKTLTNGVHEPNTIALPFEPYEYIRKTPYSTQVPVSILRYITDPLNGFNINEIHQAPELADSGTGSTDQMLVYEKSDEVLQFRIPMEARSMAPEQRNLEFLINMEAECAGMVVRYPLALTKVYGIG